MHPGECLCRDQEVWDFGTINIMTELVSQWGPTLTAFTDNSCSSIVVYFFFFFWVMTLISSAVGTSAFHPVRNQMNVSSWPDHNWTQMDFPGCFFFFFWLHIWQVCTQSKEIWQDFYSSVSCLWEVLSMLPIWPWTCTKLLNSSCIKH